MLDLEYVESDKNIRGNIDDNHVSVERCHLTFS